MKHELKTLADVHNVINEKNIDNFLSDFEQWLRFGIEMRTLSEKMKADGVGHIDRKSVV